MLVSLLRSLLNKIEFRPFLHLARFFGKKEKSYGVLSEILGFSPNDTSIYHEALLHKSSCQRDQFGRYQNNERLEFLGDSILNAVIADVVYKKFPTNDEGFLSDTRSKIVQRDNLDKVAHQLGLNRLIVIPIKVTNLKTHIMGNTLEALIGAVYLDGGYVKTKKFIEKCIIRPFIDIDLLARKEINFKSKLFEWSQKNKVSLQFQDLENFTDNNRNLIFQTQILLNKSLAGAGLGFSKRESQQHASKMSLEKIQTDKIFRQRILSSEEKQITSAYYQKPYFPVDYQSD